MRYLKGSKALNESRHGMSDMHAQACSQTARNDAQRACKRSLQLDVMLFSLAVARFVDCLGSAFSNAKLMEA